MKIEKTNHYSYRGDSETSILEAALTFGLVLPYSCKNGRCGICKTTLLRGEILELQEQLALSSEEKDAHKILTCCCAPKSDILIDAEDLSALHGILIKTLPTRISGIKKHTDEILEVTLRLPPSATFDFLEGQYIDVMWNNCRRSYSIASTSRQKEITLLIRRVENGVMSDYWFCRAKENDLLRLEGPKGTFFFRGCSRDIVFLATGTGIAPIISILNKLDASISGEQSCKISVYWGNRGAEDFFWQPKFEKLQINFFPLCSKPNCEWAGGVGYVQDLALSHQSDMSACDVYACGSNEMIQSAQEKFIKNGLPENRFYSDAFVQSY